MLASVCFRSGVWRGATCTAVSEQGVAEGGGGVRLGQHDFFYLTSFGPGDRLFMLLLMMMAERGNKLKARPGDGSTSYATDVMHIYSLLTDQSGCRWPDGADVSTN